MPAGRADISKPVEVSVAKSVATKEERARGGAEPGAPGIVHDQHVSRQPSPRVLLPSPYLHPLGPLGARAQQRHRTQHLAGPACCTCHGLCRARLRTAARHLSTLSKCQRLTPKVVFFVSTWCSSSNVFRVPSGIIISHVLQRLQAWTMSSIDTVFFLF